MTRLPLAATLMAWASVSPAMASDPIVQTKFTADPAPMVHDGAVYLYTSHDEDDAPPGQGRFRMRDWLCYSSRDMVNWTDHGAVASLKTFEWAVQENDAWAPQVIERDDKFYLYAPVSVPGWPKNVIAIAVADSPLGPFKDPLGRPLIEKKTGYIDPSPFIDDDGQAYLYWGNPNVWYTKLNDDMISTSGEIVLDESFAKQPGQRDPFHYQEGPWVYKRRGRYYMSYATTCCPEGIGYATSDRPTGPWKFGGYIMPPDRRATGNHPGIIEFKDRWYVFGFNFKLNFAITDEHHERRSVCVAQMHYEPDGSIRQLPWWEEAEPVEQLAPLDPYQRTEAETIAWSEGLKSDPIDAGGIAVYPTRDGAHLRVKGADFGTGADAIEASLRSDWQGGVEVRLDAPDGPLITKLEASGDGDGWVTVRREADSATGVHDLCFVFTGDAATTPVFDWWRFDRAADPDSPQE